MDRLSEFRRDDLPESLTMLDLTNSISWDSYNSSLRSIAL
jgi:hypothetical protein